MKQLPFRVKLFSVSLLLVMVGTDMLGLMFLRQMQTLMIARETQAASFEAAITVSHIANDLSDALIWNYELSPQIYQDTLNYYQQFYADQGVYPLAETDTVAFCGKYSRGNVVYLSAITGAV